MLMPIEPLLVMLCASVYAGGEWGTYKLFEAVVFLFMRIATMSLDRGLVWMAGRSDRPRYEALLVRAPIFVCAFGTLLGLGAVSIYQGYIPGRQYVFGGNLGIGFGELTLFMASIPAMSLGLLASKSLAVHGDFQTGIVMRTIIKPLLTYGGAFVLYTLSWHGPALATSLLVGELGSTLYGYYQVARQIQPRFRHFSGPVLLDKKLIRFSVPLMFENFLASLAARVDIFILAGVSGVKSVEVYSIVMIVGKSLVAVRQSFERVLLAVLSARGASPDHATKASFLWLLERVVGMNLIIVCFIAIWSKPLLGLLGGEYARGATPLLMFCIIILLGTAFDFSSTLATALGRTWVAPVVQVVNLSLSVLGNLYLIPRYDVMGAMMAQGFALFASSSIWFIVARKGFAGGLLDFVHIAHAVVPIFLYIPAFVVLFINPNMHWVWVLPWYIVAVLIHIGLWHRRGRMVMEGEAQP